MKALLCPACSGALCLDGSRLFCDRGHSWDLDRGVAKLVPTDLLPLVRSTVASFAFKWAYDPDAVSEERRRVATYWFYDRFGFLPEGEVALARVLKGKRRILDAGCGLGNLLTTFARLVPQAEAWGVDLSPAVFEINRLYGEIPNVRLVQGDLMNLPIAGEFDFIASDGVLHHTADTRASFLSLAKRLTPGGDLLVYLYKRKAPVREFSDDWLRLHTTQMSAEECLEFSRMMVDLGRQLREAHVTLRFPKSIPLLGIQAGDVDLQRWVYWHVLKCFWDDGGNEAASVIENFDWYHPSIARRHDPEEIRAWHTEAGLEIVRLDVADSGISSWGRRPA